MKTQINPLILTLIIAFCTSTAQAQIENIGVISSIDHTYRFLPNNKTRDSYEQPNINIRYGVSVDYRVSEQFKLISGIKYATYSYQTNDEDFRWGSEGLTGSYIPDPFLPYSGTLKHEYNFVEIPINGRYEVMKEERLTYFIEIGLSANINTKQYWLGDYELNRINMSSNIGLGLELNVADKMSLSLAPIFRYHFTNTLKSYNKEYLYSAGLELSISKRL